MIVETDYVIEELLDEARLAQADREWLRQVRGTWLTNEQRRKLSRLSEAHFARRKQEVSL